MFKTLSYTETTRCQRQKQYDCNGFGTDYEGVHLDRPWIILYIRQRFEYFMICLHLIISSNDLIMLWHWPWTVDCCIVFLDESQLEHYCFAWFSHVWVFSTYSSFLQFSNSLHVGLIGIPKIDLTAFYWGYILFYDHNPSSQLNIIKYL